MTDRRYIVVCVSICKVLILVIYSNLDKSQYTYVNQNLN